jgi:hypothetical protein
MKNPNVKHLIQITNKVQKIPVWLQLLFLSLIMSIFIRGNHDPEKLYMETSNIDPYLYSAYSNNYVDMTERWGRTLYYAQRISGILIEFWSKSIFGISLGNRITIFVGLTLMIFAVYNFLYSVVEDRKNLQLLTLVIISNPLFLYEFGQDYPSLWSTIWGTIALSFLIRHRYLHIFISGIFFSFSINSWESYIYLVLIIIASYYLVLPFRLPLRFKFISITLLLSGALVGQTILSLVMYVLQNKDKNSFIFQKYTLDYLRYRLQIKTDIYDVSWNSLGTQAILVLIFLSPLVIYVSNIQFLRKSDVSQKFLSRFSILSSTLICMFFAREVFINNSSLAAAFYYLSPFSFFLVILIFVGLFRIIPLHFFGLTAGISFLMNFSELTVFQRLPINLIAIAILFLGKKYLNHKTRFQLQHSIAILILILILVTPGFSSKQTLESLYFCNPLRNCTIPDHKAQVAMNFQNWYVSNLPNQSQFFIYSLKNSPVEEDLRFRILATSGFAYSFLTIPEELDFEKISEEDFRKYLSSRSGGVILISRNISALKNLLQQFQNRSPKFKVSSEFSLKSGDLIVYFAQINTTHQS